MNTNPAAGYYAGPCSCCSNPGNWEVFSPQGVPCLWSSSDKKLVESVCELLNSLLSAPSPTEGASPADANTELVQKEVGEGLREALQSILDHLVMVDENWNPEDSELRGRVKNMIAEADAALAAPAPKPDATLADYCERCKAGQLREYRTVVMPEPYGGTGWWHWSPDAVWPKSSEKGAWFTCQVQSAAPKPAPPAEREK